MDEKIYEENIKTRELAKAIIRVPKEVKYPYKIDHKKIGKLSYLKLINPNF